MLDTTPLPHDVFLGILARSCPDALKREAERLLPAIGAIEVIHSRTGLVMQPMRDTVKGTDFHLGEVLVAEAHITLTDHDATGYGMVIGRDLEQAMAMAVLDGARTAGLDDEALHGFVQAQRLAQTKADETTLRAVEATRVDMETF